jgi:hypothetical protein
VEVYVDGLGWIQVEVTGSADTPVDPPVVPPVGPDDPPVIPPEDRPALTLIPAFAHKTYDGTYLTATGELVLTPELEALLALGYTYKATVSGTRLEVGESTSVVSSFTLFDPSGADVTDSFRLVKESGLLAVTPASVEVMLYPVTKTYDGRPLSTVHVSFLTENLPAGYYCGITCTGSQTTVGTGYAAFDIQIWYHDGTGAPEDRTHYFIIRKQYGTLTVTPAPLILKADDAEKAYDGTPLTADGISVIGGALVGVDYIYSFTLEGSQTRVGRSENIITDIVIRNQYGDDVTACYAIETVAGILRVTAP